MPSLIHVDAGEMKWPGITRVLIRAHRMANLGTERGEVMGVGGVRACDSCFALSALAALDSLGREM